MIELYGLPNDGPFWHWPTLFHFAFVALAGGSAAVTAIAAVAGHPRTRTYALVTLGLIVLDLLTLWLESPARFRFTHVWLFLSFSPTSPIWLGAWGLVTSFVTGLLLAFGRGPRLVWAGLLALGSAVALLYPGLALAVNSNRPLWTPILVALFPLTALVTVVGLAHLLRETWARRWLGPLSLASAALGVVYLYGLAAGPAEARSAFDYLWAHGGLPFLLALALLASTPALVRRAPILAALVPLVGATVVRSLIVEIGQHQIFGF